MDWSLLILIFVVLLTLFCMHCSNGSYPISMHYRGIGRKPGRISKQSRASVSCQSPRRSRRERYH